MSGELIASRVLKAISVKSDRVMTPAIIAAAIAPAFSHIEAVTGRVVIAELFRSTAALFEVVGKGRRIVNALTI